MTTLAVRTRLPLTRGVAVDVYDIDAVVVSALPAIPFSVPMIPVLALVPAISISVMVPSWTPLTDINTATAPIAIVVEP